MSLIGSPPVIFLDEPTTGLDPQSRLEVWRTVKELAGAGTTVLLTTQYLEEAEQLADRIGILHQGRVIVDGTLAELKALMPPAEVQYVEKQPSLEEVFGLMRYDELASADVDVLDVVLVGRRLVEVDPDQGEPLRPLLRLPLTAVERLVLEHQVGERPGQHRQSRVADVEDRQAVDPGRHQSLADDLRTMRARKIKLVRTCRSVTA